MNNDNYLNALNRLTGERARINAAVKFIRKHRRVITKLGVSPSLCYDNLDFDNLSRPQVLEVIKAFPGKWVKDNHCAGDRINYVLETPVDGLTLRIYGGEAPPSCEIVEKVEYVRVPAHTERRVTRTLRCQPANPDKINVLGGTTNLDGEVVPAENSL